MKDVLCVLPGDDVVAEGGMVLGQLRNQRFWLPFLNQVLLFLEQSHDH